MTGEPSHDMEQPYQAGAVLVRFLTPDRQVLWSDNRGLDGVPVPEPDYWGQLLDAAFATRLPQSGCSLVRVLDQERRFLYRAVPEYTPTGRFMGVTEAVDCLDGPASRRRGLRHSVEPIPGGTILYDPATDSILEANHRSSALTGYPPEELVRLKGMALWGETGVALLRGMMRRMAQAGHGIIWGQMLGLVRRDGGVDSCYCSLRFLPARTGGRPAAILVSMDVAVIEAETGMPRPEPGARFVMESLQDGLWECDTVLGVFYYSPAFVHVFGPDGAPGGPGLAVSDWLDKVYPGESGKLLHNYRRLLKLGRTYRLHYRVKDSGGQWRWLMSIIHAILNDGRGRPTRILGSHYDITDAMESSTKLVDMEDRLRVIFENAGIGIVVSSVEGTIAQINPAMALMLGRDREECEGRWLWEFTHPDDRERFHAVQFRILRGGRREQLTDLRLLRNDGREMWVDLTATLSRRVSDGSRYLIVMVEDVTSSRATRERLQYEATHDLMTGAWNRWVVQERLGEHIQLSLRYNQSMAFCICDLDHFKLVNDTYGHQTGDSVLVRFVQTLRAAVRETDLVGRYGGEEFAVIFPNTTVDGAAEAMRRALELFRTETFTDSEGTPFRVTATYGVAGILPGCTVKSVVAWADAALYEGKESGRNQVVIARPETGEWR